MNTDKYLSKELQYIDNITLSFQDDLEESYDDIFTDDTEIHDRYDDFLEYYKNKAEKNDETDKNFPMFQGQKLAEIVSLHPDFYKTYNKITRSNCYNFLYNKMLEKLPNDKSFPKYTDLCSRDALKHWISRKKKPCSRIQLYKISFALDLPIENSRNNFSHTALFNKVFHVRNVMKTPDELCLLYAKMNQLSYQDAINLYKEYLNKLRTQPNQKVIDNRVGTKTIVSNLVTTIISRTDFMDMLLRYSPWLHCVNDELIKRIKEYIDIISSLEYLNRLMKGRDNTLRNIAVQKPYEQASRKNTSEYSNLKNRLLYGGYYNELPKDDDIEDYREEIELNNLDHSERADYVFLPKAYPKYNSLKQQQIINSSYYEEVRRLLIYYHFLIYWNPLKDDFCPDCDDYIEEINQLLYMYMLPPLYVFNMFDFFYIYCARAYDPIGTFLVLSELSMKKNEEENINSKISKRKQKKIQE